MYSYLSITIYPMARLILSELDFANLDFIQSQIDIVGYRDNYQTLPGRFEIEEKTADFVINAESILKI